MPKQEIVKNLIILQDFEEYCQIWNKY